LILVSLYTCCIDTTNSKEFFNESREIISDFKEKEKEIYGRLDPSIRHHIQKRGISIKANTYIGFDTNSLVSAQLAVTTKTYVHIPRVTGYKISVLDEKSNKVIKLKTNSPSFNYVKIESSIQMCINRIRSTKYSHHDRDMLIVSECLRMIRGLSYFEHPDYTIFSLPRSIIQPYIQYGGSFSFKQIVEISSSLSKTYLDNSNKILMKLIKTISDKKFNLVEGRDKFCDEIYKVFGGYKEIEELTGDNVTPLPLIPFDSLPTLQDEKRLTRNYVNELFDQKVSITNTKSYYIIAHLTPADLSLLSDFKDIKEELTIVNGSFVTIGKPITVSGKRVHIRDTMLLAPGSSRSLANIGRLYSEEFNKVKINKEDLEDMQGFLFRDKEKFTEYALKDAIISLIHAS